MAPSQDEEDTLQVENEAMAPEGESAAEATDVGGDGDGWGADIDVDDDQENVEVSHLSSQYWGHHPHTLT